MIQKALRVVQAQQQGADLVATGGLFHGIQLWVNLPAAEKRVPPRYQDIHADRVTLMRSEDGGALVRVIAGDLAGQAGPGTTHTPIVLAHASLSPGAELNLPWPSAFNALAYVLAGRGTVGAEARPIASGQLAAFGPGDTITVRADEHQDEPTPNLDVLLLGGAPIREPVVQHGPFVMNTRQEIIEAFDDYQAGRMGQIPAGR